MSLTHFAGKSLEDWIENRGDNFFDKVGDMELFFQGHQCHVFPEEIGFVKWVISHYVALIVLNKTPAMSGRQRVAIWGVGGGLPLKNSPR